MSKINAVRTARERTGMPLREAKELVEQIQADLQIDAQPVDPVMTKTLRDEFAMAALTGMLAGGVLNALAMTCKNADDAVNTTIGTAYEFAEAMLKERAR